MEREMHSAILVGGSMLNRERAPVIEKEHKQVVAKSTPAVYEVIERPYYYQKAVNIDSIVNESPCISQSVRCDQNEKLVQYIRDNIELY